MATNFPNSPVQGQIHNVAPGMSYVYLSGIWTTAQTRTALPKNYLVNPDTRICQQGNPTSFTASGFFADQWKVNFVVSATQYDGISVTNGYVNTSRNGEIGFNWTMSAFTP